MQDRLLLLAGVPALRQKENHLWLLFQSKYSMSIGANNLLDVFPDKQAYSNSYFGVFKYAPVQMGTTGAFYFIKALVRIANK